MIRMVQNTIGFVGGFTATAVFLWVVTPLLETAKIILLFFVLSALAFLVPTVLIPKGLSYVRKSARLASHPHLVQAFASVTIATMFTMLVWGGSVWFGLAIFGPTLLIALALTWPDKDKTGREETECP